MDKYPPSYRSDKPNCVRLPDHPSAQQLKDLGVGNDSYDEGRNGLLCLDEAGTWFNSQGWNDPDRKAFRDVLIHLRKLGWDLILIVQHFEMVDKQARQGVCEHLVECRRTDRISIPVVSWLTKALTGKPFPLPRVHIGKVWYGDGKDKIKADVWRYRGTEMFDFYNTKQIFSPDYSDGSYCYLKPSNYHYDKTTIAAAQKDYQIRSLKRLWHIRPPVLFFFLIGFIAAFTFQGVWGLFKSSTTEAIASEESTDPLSSNSPAESKDQIVLGGVFRVGDKRFYYFSRNDEPYDPAVDGYAYMPHGKCGAKLVKDQKTKIILCTRKDDDEIAAI